MKLYILSMQRYGNNESHHYNCGLFTDLADCVIEGLEHERARAGKYDMLIEFASVDRLEVIKEIPREVAINYAIIRYPEKFNDKKQLKDEE